jgi:glycosyl transferase family 25
LKGYEIAEITTHAIFNASFIFYYWRNSGYTIVGTTDPMREPGEKEVVIVYGAYPHWHHMLPHSNKMYQNIKLFFTNPNHTVFESDECWRPVDQIYILNLEERQDRFVDTCLELARLRAPLDRVVHYKAKKDGRSPYYGATKNHVDAVEMFQGSVARTCLILEDDFCFTGSVQTIKNTLAAFWAANYDYHICFLSASKSGRREIHDNLLLRSYQVCTTSSGYFLTKPRSAEVFEVIKEGYDKMEETGDTNTYCIDRYWNKLAGQGRMFIFREKMGMQRATYSNIQGIVTYNLD